MEPFEDVKVLTEVAKFPRFKALTHIQSRSVRQEIMICYREPWVEITFMYMSFLNHSLFEGLVHYKCLNLKTDEKLPVYGLCNTTMQNWPEIKLKDSASMLTTSCIWVVRRQKTLSVNAINNVSTSMEWTPSMQSPRPPSKALISHCRSSWPQRLNTERPGSSWRWCL